MLNREFIADREAVLNALRESKLHEAEESPEQSLIARKEIVRIDFALKRIQQRQYGICTNCGVCIEQEFLVLVPETLFCLDCAKQIDGQ
jgi:RNA polymerase-binding transcription factor DksA